MKMQVASDSLERGRGTRWTGRFSLPCLFWAVVACQSERPTEARPGDVSVSKEAAKPAAAATGSAAPGSSQAAAPAVPPSAASAPEAAAAAPAAGTPSAPTSAGSAPERKGLAPAASASAAAAEAPAKAAQAPAKAADAPAKDVKAELKQGAVVSEEPFSTWLEASSPLPVGSASSFDVVLVAKAPYHTNAEYPHKFKLNAAPAGLRYPEEVVKGMQVRPDRSVLRVPVQAERAGAATVSGTLSFSVCTEERCLVEKRELSLNLEAR